MPNIARIPPQNLEAEEGVLGSMMLERPALLAGVELIRADDFYRPNHQEIFDALVEMAHRDEPVDLITLQEELRKRGKLDDCGGTEYLMALVDSVPTAVNVEHYAGIVADKADLRRLIAYGQEIVGAAQAEEEGARDMFIARALEVNERRMGSNLRELRGVMQSVWDRLESYSKGKPKRGVSWGLSHLDNLTYGVLPGDLVLVGARPSQGKTCLLIQCALNAARAGIPTLFFSLEMSAEEIGERMAFSLSRVDAGHVHRGRMEDHEWSRVGESIGKLWELPLWIDDRANTITQVVAATKQAMLQHHIGVVLIDYLQLVVSVGRAENRNVELQGIMRALNQLTRPPAKVGVVVATQLNRQSARREDRRPQLEDLREGGSQEADAKKVVLIHNPIPICEEGINEDADAPRKALLIVAKHRGGRTGTVVSMFSGGTSRFDSCDDQHVPEEPISSWWTGDDL